MRKFNSDNLDVMGALSASTSIFGLPPELYFTLPNFALEPVSLSITPPANALNAPLLPGPVNTTGTQTLSIALPYDPGGSYYVDLRYLDLRPYSHVSIFVVDGDQGSDPLTVIILRSQLNHVTIGASFAQEIIGVNENIFSLTESSDVWDVTHGIDNPSYVNGLGGNDTITGGRGTDIFFGDDGNDLLMGGRDNDELNGGVGIDTAVYSSANLNDYEIVQSDIGVFQVRALSGTDEGTDDLIDIEFIRLGGLNGTDYSLEDIFGTEVTVTLTAGDDDYLGTSQSETISGLAGNDIIRGAGGNDSLFGGDGDDLLFGGTGADGLNGGEGIDTISYIEESAGVTVNLTSGMPGAGAAAGDTFFSIENVSGSDFDDVITGTSGVNTLYGNAGNDNLDGGAGEDVVYGGAGDDVLTGGEISSSRHRDYLYGGEGNDILNVHENGNGTYLVGGEGDDVLNGAESTFEYAVFSSSNLSDYEFTELNPNQYQVRSLNGVTDGTDVLNDISTVILGGVGGTFYSILDLIEGETLDLTSGDDVYIGTVGDDTVNGLAGNDILYGFLGDDALYGGAGDDILYGGLGEDILDGGDGIDTVNYEGEDYSAFVDLFVNSALGSAEGDTLIGIENLSGTTFRDVFRGGSEENVFYGLGGDDLLQGRNGDDTLIGGLGDDELDGGRNNDVLFGGAGNDEINGGTEDDVAVYVSANVNDYVVRETGALEYTVIAVNGLDEGVDILTGVETIRLGGVTGTDYAIADLAALSRTDLTDGDDDYTATEGFDTIYGLEGNDIIRGLGGEDLIFGGVGDDTLIGGDDADALEGGEGNDTLIGDTGDDRLIGGAGNDTLIGGTGSDRLDGGDGIDTVSYAETSERIIVDLGANRAHSGAEGDVLISIENLTGTEFGDVLYGNDSDNVLIGGSGNDTFRGALGNDIIFGGSGDDNIDGGAGDDSLYGGGGVDWAIYDSANLADYIFTEIAADEYTVEAIGTTGEGIDTLSGIENLRLGIYNAVEYSLSFLANATTINLTTGDDDYTGSSSDEIINGFEGHDVIRGVGGDNILQGGEGDDTLIGGVGADTFNGGAGTDTASYEDAATFVSVNFRHETVDGAALGDRFIDIENLTGSDFDDVFYGDGGANILIGGLGNDDLFGYRGEDTLYGGAGDDSLDGYWENDILYGGSGDDDLDGGRGNDLLYGDEGNDIFFGDFGDDLLHGGAGNDALNGYVGVDTAVYSSLNTSDYIVTETAPGEYTVRAIGGTGEGTDTLIAVEFIRLGGIDGVDYDISMFPVNNSFVDLTNEDDVFSGTEFNEIINALDGNDRIDGGAGNNTLNGDGGNDTLISLGNDILNGGTGNDIVEMGRNVFDTATATDGGGDIDTISFSTLAQLPSGNLFLVIDLQGQAYSVRDGGTVLYVDQFTNFESATGSEFRDLLQGDAGVNLLQGLGGDDNLQGRDGDDTIDGGAGADILNGGDGIDLATYASATAGVTAIIGDVSLNTGGAAGDSYISIENITGSSFDDILGGDANANIIDGGAGTDIASYAYAASAIVFDGLGLVSASGDIVDDTLLNIEGIGGTDFNDRFFGANDTSIFYGGAGADRLFGRNGDDQLLGEAGDDIILGGRDNDFIDGGADNDQLRGNEGDDTLLGGEGNDVLAGGAGADAMDGGAGIDRVEYTYGTNAGVTASLGDASINTGDAAGDTYINIENLYGTTFNDALYGDAGNNRIDGRLGDDMLFGGDGNDYLIGGAGEDILNGEAGNDLLLGQAGADIYQFDAAHGTDRIVVFTQGEDLIEFTEGVFDFSGLTITQDGAHVNIVSSEGTIIANNSLVADFTADDFIFAPPPSNEPLTSSARQKPLEDIFAHYEADLMAMDFDALI